MTDLSSILATRFRLRWTVFLWGLLLLQQLSLAQATQQLTVEDGLSQGFVMSMVQDPDGVMWMGTLDGLNCYNGSSFISFRHQKNKKNGIGAGIIQSLLLDAKGRLWVATNMGIQLMDREKGVFYDLPCLSGVEAQDIRSLCEDAHNRIWCVKETSISYLQLPPSPKGGIADLPAQIQHHKVEYNASQFWRLSAVVPLDSCLLLGTDAGVYQLSYTDYSIRPFNANLPREAVYSMWRQANDGSIWVQYESKLLRWTHPNTAVKTYPIHPSHLQNRQGGLTMDSCVYFFDNTHVYLEDKLTREFREILIPEEILIGVTDQQGNLWIGTNARGVRIIRTQASPFEQYLEGKSIGNPLVFDHQGQLWVRSYWEGGDNLYHRFSFKQNRLEDIRLPANFPVVAPDRKGGFWILDVVTQILSHRDSFGKIDQKLDLSAYYAKKLFWFSDLNVLRSGRIALLTTFEFLYILDPPTGRRKQLSFGETGKGQPEIKISAISEMADGSLFLGYNKGLAYIPKQKNGAYGKFRKYSDTSADSIALSNRQVFSLCPDPRNPNILWVGTQHGLNRLDLTLQKIKHYTMAEGMPNDVIYSILPDEEGDLWLGTNKGLLVFNTDKEEFSHYSAADGLRNIEFNTNIAVRMPDGALVFGGVNGITRFSPKVVKESSEYPSTLLLTDILINGSPLTPEDPNSLLTRYAAYTSAIEIPKPVPVLTVRFSLLQSKYNVRAIYRYRMIGLVANWTYTGSDNSVSFAKLPPGTYRFEVQGKNGAGPWSALRTLNVTIQPPWWQTAWAFLAYFLIAVASIYWGWHSFQARQTHRRQQKQLEDKEKLIQFKNTFLANISHEIRTPLTILLGLSEELTVDASAAQKTKLESMLQAGQDVMDMMEQILDMSRLDQEAIQLNIHTGNIKAFVDKMSRPFVQMAAAKDIQLTIALPETSLWGGFDPRYLKQILANLLFNAIKFTPKGKTIELRLAPPENNVFQISVTDTGIGIAPEELTRIFNLYYQVPEAQPAAGTGSGIGLAYVKKLLELMGGTVAVSSEPGSGSVFTVSLPWVAAVGLPDTDDLPQETMESVLPVSRHPSSSGTLPGILVVEDNPVLAELIASSLQPLARVEVAADGQAGLKKALASPPDLIVSDVMMPLMDGFEFCEALKSNRLTSHIPVILLTALGDNAQRIEGHRRGAEVYLTKPFSPEALRLQVRNLLAIRKVQQKELAQELIGSGAGSLQVPASEQDQSSTDYQLIAQMQAYIAKRFNDPAFSVADLQQLLTMGKSQLHRKVTALTGYSPGALIREFRLEQSKSMLLAPENHTIAHIAYQCGFTDPNYFSRAFTARYGQSPSGFREELDK